MAVLSPESISPAGAAAARTPAAGGGALAGDGAGSVRVAARWAALHDAAGVVAALAGESDSPDPAVRSYPAVIAQQDGWRLRLAVQGMDDLSAILSSGITALLCVHRGGGNAAAPARALWVEFLAARAGLIALCPDEALERRRLG